MYLDYLQNRHGQTIVAPFSVRPLPGATVSMPLLWDEVNDSLDPKAFTIKTAIERMERLTSDPGCRCSSRSPIWVRSSRSSRGSWRDNACLEPRQRALSAFILARSTSAAMNPNAGH